MNILIVIKVEISSSLNGQIGPGDSEHGVQSLLSACLFDVGF